MAFTGVNPAGGLGQVWIETDHSHTDSRGNLYVLGSVDPPGDDPLDVMFIRSTDDGDTWSDPIRVNDDSVDTKQDKLGDYYDMISDNTTAHLAYAATFTGGQDVYYLPIEAVIPCDFDDDRLCDTFDINDMLNEGPISDGVDVTPGVNDQFDLTGDGVIDLEDRDRWLAIAGSQNGLMSPYKLGDANLDGIVDGVDFIEWNEHKFTERLLWDEGNFNGDAVNDGQDFIEWNNNKFTSSDIVNVPEPTFPLAMLLLLGLGVAKPLRR